MNKVEWYNVYILRCVDGTLYTGIAKDLLARIIAHNKGTGAKYTKARRPVALAWSCICDDRGAALRYVARIKRMLDMDRGEALK